MRRSSASSVCTRERIPRPTRSCVNWNWTMRPNEGSWLSISTQSRFVCVLFFFTIGICGDSVYHHVSSFSECRVSGGRQYPFTRHASRPLQHPHPGHPSSRGSASLHTEEEHLFWVGIIQVNSVCDAAEYHCATEVILYLRVSQ